MKKVLTICLMFLIGFCSFYIGRTYYPEVVVETIYAEPVVIEEETTIRYELTESEFNEVCEVVMAEAGGECYKGQRAVAQCILNASLKDDIRPTEAIKKYKYTNYRKTPSESVREAVRSVFVDGNKVTNEAILFFYAPKWSKGEWHETQKFVAEIGGHRFFALKE